MARYVLGISGASGIILAQRSLELLTAHGHEVELVMSNQAAYTASLELGFEYRSPQNFVDALAPQYREQVRVHRFGDCGASVASGSYRTDGMLIIPCSMASLAAIACGLADNLLRRAADVTLKERRPLVIVPREAPLSEIHLENMLKLTRMGAVMVPPVPAWYNGTSSLEDVENFIVGRSLDALGVDTDVYQRWASNAIPAPGVHVKSTAQ